MKKKPTIDKHLREDTRINKIKAKRNSYNPVHRVKPALLTLAIAQALSFQATQAANIEVTSNLDDGSDCTLREALATVNAGVDQLNGCTLTGDPLGTNDTVTFVPAVAGQTITTTQGELSITKDVSINPGGVNTTIDANQASRVISVLSFETYPGLQATLNQLTITGGSSAGGIYVSNGFVQPYVYHSASLALTNSTVSDNGGDGISIQSDFGEGAEVTLTNSTVSENSGIGINDDTGQGSSGVYLINSTVSGNTYGGIRTYMGGGVSLTNSTVSGNGGYGIEGVVGSGLELINSTVTENSSLGFNWATTNPVLINSIIANNNIGYGSVFDCAAGDFYGSIDIMSGPDTISTSDCGGATVADPLLGLLADNGGPTQTHALLPGSPAIDNGTATGATAADQRGIAAEGVRDSGAFEFIASMNAITIDKLINNEARESADDAAQLLAGSLYRQVYEVTNTSPDRLYQVRVYEGGNQVCNLYTLDAGETKQSCNTVETVLDGDQHVEVTVNAKVSGTSDSVSATTDSYYSGVINGQGEMAVTHYVDNRNSDTPGQAQSLSSSQTNVLFKVENTGDIELYRVKTYHDPVSPVNSGWAQQCVMGPLKPGQVRYCKRDITLSDTGLNHAMGRVQGANAFSSPTSVINAANPTYFIVP